jgi:hypothetical protein
VEEDQPRAAPGPRARARERQSRGGHDPTRDRLPVTGAGARARAGPRGRPVLAGPGHRRAGRGRTIRDNPRPHARRAREAAGKPQRRARAGCDQPEGLPGELPCGQHAAPFHRAARTDQFGQDPSRGRCTEDGDLRGVPRAAAAARQRELRASVRSRRGSEPDHRRGAQAAPAPDALCEHGGDARPASSGGRGGDRRSADAGGCRAWRGVDSRRVRPPSRHCMRSQRDLACR